MMVDTTWQTAHLTLLYALETIDTTTDPTAAIRAATQAVTDIGQAARRAHTIRETHIARGAHSISTRDIAAAAGLTESRVRQIVADTTAGRPDASRRPAPTANEIRNWVHLYTTGHTVATIAADAGRPREVVRRRIEAAGTPVRHPDIPGDINNPKWLQAAWDAGLTLREIAAAAGSSAPTVRRRLQNAAFNGTP